MKLDDQTFNKLAHLSRLEFDPATGAQIKNDLHQITDWMAKLNELDTDDVEPLTHMSSEENQLRPDVGQNTISREDGLKNAPKKDSDYFRVPKVIE